MIKENIALFKKLMVLADALIVAAAFFIAYFFLRQAQHLGQLNFYLWLLPVIALIWIFLFHIFGMYWSFRTEEISMVLLIILETAGLGFLIFGAFLFALKVEGVSRFFIISVFTLSGILFALEKTLLLWGFHYVRKMGKNYRNMLVIGSGRRAQKFIELVDSHREWGLRIIGLLDEDLTKKGSKVCGYKVIGSMIDLPDILHNSVVDEVFFIVPRSWINAIADVILFLETEGVRVHIAEDFFTLKFSRMKQTDLHGFPLLTIESAPDKVGQLALKRLFDFFASGLALLVLSPLFGVIALVIKLSSLGPVFFRQERVGVNGRKFTLLKFRTMVKDAEKKLESLRVKNEMKGPVFKISNDPRITPVGAYLRKFSLDELPQLWNVFKGDMSLVGPRPPLAKEVKEYDSWQRRRLSMKPGITCIWQAEGRNKITDFNEWAKLDLEYIDTWSIWLDLKLLFKTVPAVLFGIGAK